MKHRGGAAIIAAATLLVALSACGDDPATAGDDGAETPTSTSPSSTPNDVSEEPSGLPQCSEAWVDGATLPADYAGCADSTGEVMPESLDCSSGQVIVTYDDTYWAVPGAVVNATDGLEGDRSFKRAKLSCFG